MANRILVVDDDLDIRTMLSIILSNEGYEIVEAENGQEAIGKLLGVDLVLLDVMMPVMDGIAACREIRKKSNIPIIFLTAKQTEIDQITGLSIGADDYIVKPFKPALLSARIRALLRRSNYSSGQNKDTECITIRDLKIDTEFHIATLKDVELDLTPTEFEILLLLMKNKGRVYSMEQIYEHIWEEPYIKSSANTVMVHIRKLREKIEEDSSNPEYVKTKWGVGYKVE